MPKTPRFGPAIPAQPTLESMARPNTATASTPEVFVPISDSSIDDCDPLFFASERYGRRIGFSSAGELRGASRFRR